MKIIKAIKDATTGVKLLLIQCNCGETIRHPIYKEKVVCNCSTKVVARKKMLIKYYTNRQERAA